MTPLRGVIFLRCSFGIIKRHPGSLNWHCSCYHRLLDGTPQSESVARLNALLAAKMRSEDPESGLLLFRRTHLDGVRLDGYSLTRALAACVALPAPEGSTTLRRRIGRQLHALGVKNGSLSGPIARTALMDMYAKCDCERPDDAVQMFDEMEDLDRDAVAWNALLSCFVRHGQAAEAICGFRRMTVEERVEATGFTLATLLKACGSLKARRLGEQIHASLVVAGARNSVVLGTALLDFYSDCGLLDHAVQVFDGLPCRKDATAYAALANACVQNRRYGEAFATIRKAATTACLLTSGLAACSQACNLQFGKQIHCAAVRRGFGFSSAVLCNALLDMYAKCGVLDEARKVFDQTKARSVVSWTSIINAYGRHGRGGEAVRLFREMEKGEPDRSVPPPNAATFLSVLSACGHAGLVDEGRACFASMSERHGVEPGPEHYACLIALLGRAGRIEEAWDLFLGGAEPAAPAHPGVLVAMLNACAACRDVARGEAVASRLLETVPESASVHVLLSNFYAAVGMWEEAEELRKAIRRRWLTREGGSSWVEAR